MVKDTISEFIIKLKNASSKGEAVVLFPSSKMVQAISEILLKEGYLSNIDKKGRKNKKFIEVTIASKGNALAIGGVKRVSKSSRRVYSKAKQLYPVLSGYGRAIISTPKGLMTDKVAKKENLGGEILFNIW